MNGKGLLTEIPGFGNREICTVVSDYTGTLSCAGKVVPGVLDRLSKIKEFAEVRVVSSDSFGTAEAELRGIVKPDILKTGKHDLEKQELTFGLKHVEAFGNGNNDRSLLKTVKDGGGLAIAVDNGEGCAIGVLLNVHLFIAGAVNTLNLL